MLPDSHNPIFELATQFVTQTDRPIFLTGKAGTGKTTFLKYIREHCFKKMAIVAPTGVAAINAGGVTLHSFFQLPFGPYIPLQQQGWDKDSTGITDPHTLFKNIRFNADKRELLQELELLVIDEVSMVRADMLDAVDTILRHFRQRPLSPFGGVQVLYIGDLFQLPPIVQREEWELLRPYYKSPFFFDAKVLLEAPPVYLELKKIYRQNEADFIHILNNIRNNRTTREDLETLHTYYKPDFSPVKEENYITLTSHNAQAESINQAELTRLPGKLHGFEATVTGEFNDKSFPAEKTLRLKEGAQIMFIKNDKGETRRYFNGKIGRIEKINGDKIIVVFPGGTDELIVEKETWRNIRYNYDREKDKIEEEELGSFSQYPIRLAWAITIHKSQGLTFEKAIIDAGASFAPGQVYVALSRLTAIRGLVLRSRIHAHSISTDERVIAFTNSHLEEDRLKEELQEEQKVFIARTLVQSYNWSRLVEELQANQDEYEHRQIPDLQKATQKGAQLLEKALAQQETALKFSRQLEQLTAVAAEDGYRQLDQRIQAAAAYFGKAVQEELITPLQEHIDQVRVKQKVKKYLATLKDLKILFRRKQQQIDQSVQLVSGLVKGIDPANLLSDLQEQKKNSQEASATAPTPDAPSGKAKKGDTHRISLELFKEGRSIADISTLRSLAMTTIEGHLATFILTGEISVRELVPENKIAPILSTLEEARDASIVILRQRLGEEYSFGEIRAVRNHLTYLTQQSSHPS